MCFILHHWKSHICCNWIETGAEGLAVWDLRRVNILCWVSIKICLFIVATEGFTSHSQTLLIQFYPPKYIRVIYVCDTVKKQRLYHV